MARTATYDDVNLILRLYELRREEKLREARDWFARNFKPRTFEEATQLAPEGSASNAYVRMVTSYWEMVSTFITGGVLNEELFFESGHELLACWLQVSEAVPGVREEFGNPLYMKNLEEVARRYRTYLDKTAPGVYDKYLKMIRG